SAREEEVECGGGGHDKERKAGRDDVSVIVVLDTVVAELQTSAEEPADRGRAAGAQAHAARAVSEAVILRARAAALERDRALRVAEQDRTVAARIALARAPQDASARLDVGRRRLRTGDGPKLLDRLVDERGIMCQRRRRADRSERLRMEEEAIREILD